MKIWAGAMRNLQFEPEELKHRRVTMTLIVSIIARSGSATRQEIWDEIFARTHGGFPCELESHNRQISRMEKTFQIIEPVERKKDAALARYQLTGKGKRLYSETLTRFIEPLRDVLADS